MKALHSLEHASMGSMLSVPYALSEGGWLSLIALLVIAIVCFYTGLLMKKCMDRNPLIKTYPDIGAQAFGKKGRIVISTFMDLELFLLAVEFLILEGDNLHKLFPNVCVHVFRKTVGGKQVFILLTALVMLPTTWFRSLSVLLAYVSAGGILASIVLIGTVFWIGAFEGVGFNQKGVLWRYNGLPTTISLFTFCYCGHPVFPTLCTSMKDKSQFPKVLQVCFIMSTISYGSMAILGYMMYGENLVSQVTLNLPIKSISSKIAIYATLINPITKYALIISPIAVALEDVTIFPNSKLLGSGPYQAYQACQAHQAWGAHPWGTRSLRVAAGTYRVLKGWGAWPAGLVRGGSSAATRSDLGPMGELPRFGGLGRLGRGPTS
ncbi:hypothetical protein BUALT_Bualt09G0006200 [Buddleja alternifolia]|uniref:Amino acid transporter transmembrane domain-containing protein n=1 Tax=Buddleja alternifolia TaxID=168488 RepID=A0AAV6X3D4_9LAMI|nr:hypothetical protein BUALT_Bualt09G0006200 [Buddleja alternifolia]